MKTLAAVIILAASTCAAQSPSTNAPVEQHKPIQCPQYQHEEYIPEHCDAKYGDINTSVCFVDREAYTTCVDDVHVLTEKQYKALVDSIKEMTALIDLQQKQLDLITGRKK